jgi:CHAD domain-containing protein
MTYRFKLQEPIALGVRCVGIEQLDIAAARLGSKDDIPAAIHDARRCLKRLRALLRLIRPGLGDAAYRREAKRLTGTGKLLSGARDLFVMQQTLAKLEDRFGAMPNGGAERLRKLLAQGHARGRRSGPDARRQALQRLDQARRLFTGKAADGIELEHVVDGLETVYRKARKAFRHAYREPSDETFHAWRKKVQVHWRHMSLLSRGWPEALSARAGEAKELSRLLGEDHDYSVLLAFAAGEGASRLEPQDIAALAERCRACQADLRAQARPRGERLFAERADDLKERVTLYWTSAGCLAAMAPAKDQEAAKSQGPRQRGSSKGERQGPRKTLRNTRYRRRAS